MPIEVGIWKLGDTIQRVQFTPVPSEKRIEDIIADDTGPHNPPDSHLAWYREGVASSYCPAPLNLVQI